MGSNNKTRRPVEDCSEVLRLQPPNRNLVEVYLEALRLLRNRSPVEVYSEVQRPHRNLNPVVCLAEHQVLELVLHRPVLLEVVFSVV